MRKRVLFIILTAAACSSIAVAAAKFLKVRPAVYDPGDTGLVAAAWVAKQGLPDVGKADQALYLAKMTTTATDVAGGAIVDGVKGVALTEIGWDVRTDSHCTAGAPRFNVVTSDNVLHVINCNSPLPVTTTLLTDRRNVVWERRRYDPAAAVPPITLGSTVKSITISFEEGTDVGQGWAYLDNIDINGTLIGKAGNVQRKKK